MSKVGKIILLITIITVPVIFYFYFNFLEKGKSFFTKDDTPSLKIEKKPQVVLIFDDLGENLRELKEIYALKIPVTVAVIPHLRFSKNIASIASRCGYSVLVHLPMEPKERLSSFLRYRNKFITTDLSPRKLNYLLKYHLNSLRVAIGANNHMGSKATEDERVMRAVIKALRVRDMVFVDSKTSPNSLACQIAKEEGVMCVENSGFLDSRSSSQEIKDTLYNLLAKADKEGKIIIIAHPKENTFKVLKEEIPKIKEKIEFITLKDYFGL
ncbi:MAG: hypothetical protein DRP68_00030 [Candidatus Omnitrophota bacterium]|nr:MAG: hypothetical protein DRP68_00030 [Candidatus Omnitrophota bacterium]